MVALDHYSIALYTTFPFKLDCNDGDVRLMGISSSMEGRVEVCYDGVWGSVCTRAWSAADVSVTCRQLGYTDSGIYNEAVINHAYQSVFTIFFFRSYCRLVWFIWTRKWSYYSS